MSTTQKEDEKKSRVITPAFRVSFPSFFVAKPGKDGGKPKFGCMAIFTPKEFNDEEKKRWSEMIRIANAVSIEKFKLALKDLPGNFKKPFRRGDEKPEYGMTIDNIFMNITSHVAPGIVMANGTTKLADEMLRTGKTGADIIYPGCWMRASVNAYGYDNVGKGIAFGLNNLKFVKDDVRLDNRVSAEVEFGDMNEETAAPPAGEDDLGLGF